MAYSSDSDGQSPGQSLLERELTESVIRAQQSINRYMNARQKLALNQSNPNESAKLRTLLNDVDVATLSAFAEMKPYCQQELATEWMSAAVGEWDGYPVVFGSEHDEAATSEELYLDQIRGQCTAEEVTEHVRFEGRQTRVIHRPVLLDISAYVHTKDLLLDTMREADLAPEPEIPSYRDTSVITHGDE